MFCGREILESDAMRRYCCVESEARYVRYVCYELRPLTGPSPTFCAGIGRKTETVSGRGQAVMTSSGASQRKRREPWPEMSGHEAGWVEVG